MKSGGGNLKLNHVIRVIRWPIIAFVGIWILVGELFEHPGALTHWDSTFLSEVIILEGLLIAVGIAIGWLLSTIEEKTTSVKILEAKNDLSQRLTTAQDWDQMTSLLVEYPRSILPLNAASLLTYSQRNEQFELTAYWSAESDLQGSFAHIPAQSRCSHCAYAQPFVLRPIESLCSATESSSELGNDYCLPLSYGDSMRAMLLLRLPAGTDPTTDQVKLMNNLGPEMAIALRVAQENNFREQLAAEKAAEVVRQEITRDMHDMLAQNLAYMQLKLDQVSNLDGLQPEHDLRRDLIKLRDVADESYELVRSTLGALHPNNSRRLADILSQHAYTFADRAGLKINFTQSGQSQPLNPMVIHHVYQLFREALNNIDRHARANCIETNLVWEENGFTLSIVDDGLGFDRHSINENDHFGLEFMQERVEELHGEFSLQTTPGEGTEIIVFIPIESTGDHGELATR